MTSTAFVATDLLSREAVESPSGYAFAQRRIISFGALPPASFPALRAEKTACYQQRIQAWIGEEGERLKPLADYRQQHAALQSAVTQTQTMLTVDALPLSPDNEARLIELREQSLLAETYLQLYEGTLDSADLTHIQQVIAALDPLSGSIRVAELCVVDGEVAHALSGLLIFTRQSGLDQPELEESALLFVPGNGGGLQKFLSLQDLQDQVLFTLQSGIDTPFWRHVPAMIREAVMDSAKADVLKLIARIATSPAMTHSVSSQIATLQAASQANAGGQRLFADATDPAATLTRLHLEACDNLSVHICEARDCAIDHIAELQRTGALVPQIPLWLLQASPEVRREYAQQLTQYHDATALLEKSLARVLPSLNAFTRKTLEARLKIDLGIEINTDQVFIELPERATQQLDIDPQFGMLRHGPWIASSGLTRLSLAELARQNIDSQDAEMKARLSFARIDLPTDAPAIKAGLTVASVATMIPQLDIAKQYRALLQQVFETRPEHVSLIPAELLLRPYELDILLDGFAGVQRRLISTRAYHVLQSAVRARSNADLRAAQLQISWVVLNPGHSVSGETRSATLPGLCVIHHQPTGITLIYLPQSIDGVSLIEADSPASARQRLINRLNADPSLIDYLVARIPEEERREGDQRYIEVSLKRKFDGFIEFTPGLFLQMAAQQVHARAWLSYAQSRQQARSNGDIHLEHSVAKNQRYLGYFKALLSFLPGVGTLISLQDGWHDGHAAAAAFGQGRKFEGEKLTASTALCVLDVLLSVVPGVATMAVIAKAARHATQLRRAIRAADALPSVTGKRYVLTPFKGYEVDMPLLNAIKQHGADAGTYLKDGELWIQRQGQRYAVYRRKGEQTLRLKKTASQGYEPPVRLDAQGHWVYHTNVGLKGGVRSSIAETLIAEANPDAGFTRRQARELLDQFAFPLDQQRRLELDLAVHYQSHRVLPEWAETYRRPRATVIQSTSQVPSGSKRKQPPVDPAQTDRQPAQPMPGPSQALTPSPVAAADAWKSWGRKLDDASLAELIRAQPPVYRLPGAAGESAVKIGDEYFAVLPDGSTQNPTIVFLRKPAASPSQGSFSELNETIRINPYDQPLMASIKDGQWTVHGPLFRAKIQQLIGEIRPVFTPISQRVLAEKLYQLADSPGQILTATRLMNMKATLNAWRKGKAAPIGKLDDPLDMLEGARPTRSGHHSVINISYESSLDDFHRLDFLSTDLTDIARLKRMAVDKLTPEELRDLMTRQLTAAGYQLVPDGQLMYWRPVLIFRRPGLDKLYVVSLRSTHNSQVAHEVNSLVSEFPLSTDWLDGLQSRYADLPIAASIAAARREGKLVRLIGGVNAPRHSGHRAHLFVMRLADDV